MTRKIALEALDPWMAPPAQDLPQWRARVRDYIGSSDHIRELAQSLSSGKASIVPVAPGSGLSSAVLASRVLARAEKQRLADAALYYVSADMTALALAAASTAPREPVSERRLPAPVGWMVFTAPIGSYTIDLRQQLPGGADGADGADGDPLEVSTPIVAVSWSLWRAREAVAAPEGRLRWLRYQDGDISEVADDFAAVWMTFWAPTGSVFSALPAATVLSAAGPRGRPLTAGQAAAASAASHPVYWDDEIMLPIGDRFRPGALQTSTTSGWSRVVYTAWQLIAQSGGDDPLIETREIARDRAGRRRDARTGIAGPSTVKIVDVHRRHQPPASAARQDAKASQGRRAPQWSCRWPVAPYRRNSCLNPHAHASGGCTHEETIVPGHLKGPAHLPLRETVRVWASQPTPLDDRAG
ncbi:hypothetical protein ACIBH1_48770 [Nonomuraea sp. NPDC050663]|uniref:hypothetical protein n=1 Tax=Nonomuraea sp. NPDC050663 TaxID=3364370 RepID=UPI0037B6CFBA